MPRAQIQSLVRELRSHKPCGVVKKNKQKKDKKNQKQNTAVGTQWVHMVLAPGKGVLSSKENQDQCPRKSGV